MAWVRALTAAARAGLLPLKQRTLAHSSHLAFTSGDELARALQTREYGKPPALDAVIRDAVERRELVPLSDFLNAQKSIYSKSWVPSPWQVVSWGLKQLGVSGIFGGDKLAVGNFVVLANVEEAANAIIRKATAQSTLSPTSRVYSRELFETSFSNVLSDAADMSFSSNDFSILLAFLSRDKPILSTAGQTIKFAAPGETTPSPVTEQDASIASLRTLITTMSIQVNVLTSRVTELDSSVREAVAQRHTHVAKSALRSKKLAENTLTQRSATLAQLENVYTQIEQAADQVAVVRVMEASGSVLKNLHKEVGGVEGVEGVVERLREEMDKVDDVGRIINEASEAKVDEDEVDEELAELERVEREKKEAQEAEATRLKLEELDTLEQERKRLDEEKARKQQEETEADSGGEKVDRVMQDASETA